MVSQRLLSPPACRAARGLLDWTQQELASRAGVSRSTIREFENGHHALQEASEAAVMEALAASGIEFIRGKHRIGVQMRTPSD